MTAKAKIYDVPGHEQPGRDSWQRVAREPKSELGPKSQLGLLNSVSVQFKEDDTGKTPAQIVVKVPKSPLKNTKYT